MKYPNYSKMAALENEIKQAHVPAPEDRMASIIGYIHGHENSQLATLSTSEAGISALINIKKKLDLAGDELLRMENESGIPLDASETSKVDTYFQEGQSIEKILQTVESGPAVKA